MRGNAPCRCHPSSPAFLSMTRIRRDAVTLVVALGGVVGVATSCSSQSKPTGSDHVVMSTDFRLNVTRENGTSIAGASVRIVVLSRAVPPGVFASFTGLSDSDGVFLYREVSACLGKAGYRSLSRSHHLWDPACVLLACRIQATGRHFRSHGAYPSSFARSLNTELCVS